MTVRIRRAERGEEIDAAGELTAQAYHADRLIDPGDDYVDELKDAHRRAAEAVLLVALVQADPDGEHDVVVGSITMAPHGTSYAEIAEPGELELRMLGVAPEARGRGIAEALMRATVREAARLGYRRVVLSTLDAMAAAQRLYVRLGWTRVPDRDWGHVEIHLRVYTWELAEAPGPRAERATWPPVRSERIGGFDVGMSDGVTRRANSAVLVEGDWHELSLIELDRRLAAVEADFVLAGLDPCVRVEAEAAHATVNPDSRGRTVQDVLVGRGYRLVDDTLVMVRELADHARPGGTGTDRDAAGEADSAVMSLRERVRIEASDQPTDDWLDMWLGGWDRSRQVARQILTGVPARYLRASMDGEPVGVIRVCRVGEWAGVSCLTIRPEQRGAGLGRMLCEAGLTEARALGATRAFSQVVAHNAPAVALHEGAGFSVAAAYRYAVLDSASASASQVAPGSASASSPDGARDTAAVAARESTGNGGTPS